MVTRDQQGIAPRVLQAAGVDVNRCYQCGKCTAGCPMVAYMDLAPNRVMRLVQIGDPAAEQKVLTSTAIWSCAGCLTCTQRCPRELDPAAVMDVLREMSCSRAKVSPLRRKVLAFHQAFLETVRKNGRMSEVPLVWRYKFTSRDLFADVRLAPVMLAKGKLPPPAHSIKGRREIRRIFERCRKEMRP